MDTPLPYFGMLIRIKDNCPFFSGAKATIAYIGDKGISVYLKDNDFDECIPLDNDEWEPLVEAK